MKSMYNNQMQGRQMQGNMMQGHQIPGNMGQGRQMPGGQGMQMPMNNMYPGYQSSHSQYAQTAYTNQAQQGGQMYSSNQYQQRSMTPAPNSGLAPVKPVQINSIKFNNANTVNNNVERTVLITDSMDQYMPQQQVSNQQSQPIKQSVPQIVIYGISGEYANAAFSLEQPITFGRSKEKCNLIFAPNASGVSRVHCKVSVRPDGNVLLQDLGSSYGVKVNGETHIQPGQSVLLSVGCNFTIGSNEKFEICAIN